MKWRHTLKDPFLGQAENLANAMLFVEDALQQLNYQPPVRLATPPSGCVRLRSILHPLWQIPLYSPAANVPDPGVTRTLRSRAELDALLDAISLSGGACHPIKWLWEQCWRWRGS